MRSCRSCLGRKSTIAILTLLFVGCTAQPPQSNSQQSQPPLEAEPTETLPDTPSQPDTPASTSEEEAQVIAVDITPNGTSNYQFAVTIASPDTGCDQYANWWEVVTPEGELLYRRILAHSHVDEQPFTRSGGPVTIDADQVAIVRVHMHPDGYSTQAMEGIVGKGLAPTTLTDEFASELAEAEPQPSGCTF